MEAPPQPWAEGPPGMLEVRALLESSFGDRAARRHRHWRASMPESLPEFALGPEPDVGAYQNLIRSPHCDATAAAALVDDEVHDALLDLLSTCVPLTRRSGSLMK